MGNHYVQYKQSSRGSKYIKNLIAHLHVYLQQYLFEYKCIY